MSFAEYQYSGESENRHGTPLNRKPTEIDLRIPMLAPMIVWSRLIMGEFVNAYRL